MGIDRRGDRALECLVVCAREYDRAGTDFGSCGRAETLESLSVDPEARAAENPNRPH